VRPVDPRCAVRVGVAGFFVAIAVIGAAQTAVVVAFAWLLAAITRVIDGMPWASSPGC
jgi:ATP-binding cassette subfamily C protein CydD